MLDYYQLLAAADGVPLGLLVEEFELAGDLSATRLRSAGWTPSDGGWWSSGAFARALRARPDVRARVRAVTRTAAEDTYARLGGGALPDEDTLRDRFRDDLTLAVAEPLRLGTGPAVHRVLFAGDLDAGRLAGLVASLPADGSDEPGPAGPGVVATGRAADTARWEVRRVGGGVAWCVDVTAERGSGAHLRTLLGAVTTAARRHGLIPATIERLG
ncbi:hypothetical protein ABZS44_23255 [Micromonospora sediminicola]|uniref:hypothetical protein n=1 Tax=Micromonospora sediminicola TaxID=946078 RepID=UPI0033B36123